MKVLRDGRWSEEDAAILVPGDVISIKLGDIVPADARLLEGDPLKIDQVGIQLAFFAHCVHVVVVAFHSVLLKFSCLGYAVCSNRRVTSCDKRTW